MPLESEDVVQVDIQIIAAAALEELQRITQGMTTLGQRAKETKVFVEDLAKTFGISFKEAKSALMEVDKQMAAAGQQSAIFGNQAQEGWNKVGEGSEKAAKGIDKATTATYIWHRALSILLSQAIFGLIQGFQRLFSMAISGLRELEGATYNLISAERKLSENGIGITPQDLDAIIQKVKELNPLLSNIQATELVSKVASNVATPLGFGKKQIEEISQAVSVLYVRNKALGYSFEEVEKSVTDAFLTGRVSTQLNKFGLKIDDQIVKDEALRLGMVKTAAEFDHLTGKMEANIKAQALLSLVNQNVAKDIAHLPDFFKTADAAFGIFQARLSDVLTKLGVTFAPILIKLFDTLAKGLESLAAWIDKNQKVLNLLANEAAALVPIILKLLGLFLRFATAVGNAWILAVEGIQKVIDKVPVLNKLLEKWTGSSTNTNIANTPDTPTGLPLPETAKNPYGSGYADAIQKAEDEITKIMQEARDKREDIERDYQQKLADIATDYSHKLEDIARSTARKREDAQQDYANKVEDINRDASQKEQDAYRDAAQKKIDIEQKYQQDLKDLRRKFEMDLEEALHARDARQVLHLIRQYNADKKSLDERRKIEEQQAKKDLKRKLEEIERERKLKLEAAARELADKLAQIQEEDAREREDARIAHERALADARLAHQRQLQEYQEYLKRKIRDLTDAIQKEYQLTALGAQAIFSLLNSYFGANGAVAGIFATLNKQITDALNNVNSLNSGGTNPTLPPSGGGGFWGDMFGGGLAEGGSFLATTPTTLNVAENRPELITAMPLGRPGQDVGKMFTNAQRGAAGGQIEIGLTLSPELESKIIKRTLDETANVIVKINRSKV